MKVMKTHVFDSVAAQEKNTVHIELKKQQSKAR